MRSEFVRRASARAAHRRWRQSHLAAARASDAARHRAKRAANPQPPRTVRTAEDRREYARQYRILHRAEIAARRRARLPERRAYARARYEKQRAATVAWIRRNPEKIRNLWQRRRVRERGALGSHTACEWREKVLLFGGCCIYCGESRPLTRDHNVPLTRGGSDYITNILPACASCNSSKGTRTATEFLEARRAAA